jgi:hypothetical protein
MENEKLKYIYFAFSCLFGETELELMGKELG